MKSILIADDHPFTLWGTKTYVESLGFHIADLCNNGISAYNYIMSRKPDIAILDINMPGMNGIEILEKLQQNKSPTKVILLTMHNEYSIFNRAKDLGVKGYLLKEFATKELDLCLRRVSENGVWFTEHLTSHLDFVQTQKEDHEEMSKLSFSERKILKLIAQQRTSREIAELLFVSEKTIESHRSNIIQKLALPKEKNALLMWAIKNISANSEDI